MKKILALLLISLLVVGIADATNKQVEKEITAQLRLDLRDLEAEYDARLSSDQPANHLLPMINSLRLDLGMPQREGENPLDQAGGTCSSAYNITSLPFSDSGSLDQGNDCGSSDPSNDVFYKYTAFASGEHTFDMCGSGTEASMRLTMTACCDYFITEVTASGCSGDGQPQITWNLNAGQTVYVECGGYWGGQSGEYYRFNLTGPAVGRCCHGSSSQYCTVNGLVECDNLGGTWNASLSCSTPCPGETGRCCYGDPNDPQCANNTLSQCNGLGGSWRNDLGCNSSPCPGTLGRCCYGDPNNPQCTDNTSTACAQLSGEWDITRRCDTHPCAGPCPYPNLDIEPDNEVCSESLPEVTCGDTLCGEVESNSDIDWYKLVVPTGGYPTLIIDVFADGTPGMWPYEEGLDSKVYLCDAACEYLNALYYNDDNSGPPGPLWPDSRITTDTLEAGTYFIGIEACCNLPGPYVLTLTCPFLPGRCCYGPPFDYGCEMLSRNDCEALNGVFEFFTDCTEPCDPPIDGCQCGFADHSYCNATGGPINVNSTHDFVINVPEEYHITDVNVC